jgi:hypothetical protein
MVCVPCWAVLAAAAAIHPDAQGYDTHRQLGLPACSFLQNTGMPCPTCGLTTAFAHMARGQVPSALRAQVFGTALFVLMAMGALAGAAQAITGRTILVCPNRPVTWAYCLLWGALIGWALKLWLGLRSGDLPIR